MAEGKQKVKRRQYTEEFQREAVRLADSVGLTAAADPLGVPRLTVANWARQRRKVGYLPPGGTAKAVAAAASAAALKRPAAELESKIGRLRRELASLKLDNEIFRKAAAYFARESR